MSRTYAPVRRAPVPAAALPASVGGPAGQEPRRDIVNVGADGKPSVAISSE